jgi:hypothetical protein
MTAARIELVRTTAAHLPERLGSAARTWIADRRLAPDDPVAVQVGMAADPADVAAMARAARAAIAPAGDRLQRWLSERTTADDCPSPALRLLADFNDWAHAAGEPPMQIAAFSRALRSLGIKVRLHPSTRRSEFFLRTEGVQN